MENLLGSLMKLFGNNSDFMKMLGSEGFKNLIAGGTALYQGSQMGDMLDFQKSLATKADQRTEALFQNDLEKDRNRQEAFRQGALAF